MWRGPTLGLGSHIDACAERRAVRSHTLQLQADPVAAVSGIFKQYALVAVAGQRPANLFKNVFVAIIVDIAKCHGVSLLQMAEAAGRCDVLKAHAAVIAE